MTRKLPPDPEHKNDDRAAWAGKALAAFRRETGADEEESVGDLLADLMHWCDRHDFDFGLALDRARYHYEAETSEESSGGFHVLTLDLRGGQKFPLGQVVVTRSALDAIPSGEVRQALARHARGDWGDVSRDDRQENEFSLREGFRLFSAYRAADGSKFWIITEADRSVTTVLLPLDY
jgi:hypothetical protein